MYRIAICGDIHWSTYSSILRKRSRKYSQRLEKLIKSVNWFEKISKEYKCNKEIFLGDTMDRPDLNAEELTALQDIKWNKIEKIFLVGNHESNINTLEYSSAKFFESINANVISEPYAETINDVNLNYIPYITTDKIIPLSNYIDTKSNNNIIFAHQDIAGIQYGNFISKTGFDLTDIKNNCKLFFDGHLHNEQIIDNLILVGILTGQNFNEDATKYEHKIYILTIDDNGDISYEAILNPEALNFYKIRIETQEDLDKLNNLKQNSVVSITCIDSLSSIVNANIKSNKNILESRVTIFYNYENSDEHHDDLFVDDHVQQFMILARNKLDNSAILEEELSMLGGD